MKSKTTQNIEIVAIITQWLRMGIPDNNKDIDKIITTILYNGENTPFDYIMSREYSVYEKDNSSMYKLLTWNSFFNLCEKLNIVYTQYHSFEKAMLTTDLMEDNAYYCQSIASLLSGGTMIPNAKSKYSFSEINTMLMWLVSNKIWNNLDINKILIPLTTEVVESAIQLGVIQRFNNNLYSAKKITEYYKTKVGKNWLNKFTQTPEIK